MADHIPFVTSSQTLKLVRSLYADSSFVRLSLDLADKLTVPTNLVKMWIDPGVDGLHDLASRWPDSAWYKLIKSTPGFELLSKATFIAKPDASVVDMFVASLMDRCVNHNPTWITVPQLPIVNDNGRNRLNREFAKATGRWKSASRFSGRLIFPLIFTHQEQTRGKTQRNPKLKQAHRCYHESQADGLWVVEKTLTEESGSASLRNKRFKATIELHEQINDVIPSRIRIAGPYWGMNLVLWARGLVDYPAIGVGGTYQYYFPGGHSKGANARVAIAPLRRRVNVPQLSSWLARTMKIIGPAHPDFADIERVQRQLHLLRNQDPARDQVAGFYKRWFDTIAATSGPGRSLGLFQDLSRAFALGRSLPDFTTEGAARSAESVVELLAFSFFLRM
jgi:hypothetical protein